MAAIKDDDVYKGLGAANKNNQNRQAAIIKKDENTATSTFEASLLTINKVDNYFTINDGTGYFYAIAHKDNNYLQTKTEIDDSCKWSIEIDENGIAVIKVDLVTDIQDNPETTDKNESANAKNLIRYNSNNDLFSCYGASNTQKDVVIYKLAD